MYCFVLGGISPVLLKDLSTAPPPALYAAKASLLSPLYFALNPAKC